jgi:hypothetical protein
VHIGEKRSLRVNEVSGVMEAVEADAPLPDMSRNALVLLQIESALESMVIAGQGTIDPMVAHMAGVHGKVNVGRSGAKQIHFDLKSCSRAYRRFVKLSAWMGAAQLERCFDDRFIPGVSEHMREGHSAASATADLLVNAGWFSMESSPGNVAGATPGRGAAASTSSSTEPTGKKNPTFRTEKGGWVRDGDNEIAFVTKEKYEKQKAHAGRLEEQLKQSKQRRLSFGGVQWQGGGQRQGGSYDRDRDRDRQGGGYDRDRDRDRRR